MSRSNGVDWVHWLRKIPIRLRGTNFCISSARFAPSFVRQLTVPNAPKRYETHQNISLGSNGVDRVLSLQKIPTRLRGTNFCTSSARFAPSFVRLSNGYERTQIEKKRMKTSVYGAMGWIGCVRCEKFRRDFVARTFALVRPNSPECNQIARNVPKRQFRDQ